MRLYRDAVCLACGDESARAEQPDVHDGCNVVGVGEAQLTVCTDCRAPTDQPRIVTGSRACDAIEAAVRTAVASAHHLGRQSGRELAGAVDDDVALVRRTTDNPRAAGSDEQWRRHALR